MSVKLSIVIDACRSSKNIQEARYEREPCLQFLVNGRVKAREHSKVECFN